MEDGRLRELPQPNEEELTPEEELEQAFEVFQELDQGEAALQEEARDRVAGFLESIRTHRLTPWVQRTMLAVRLLTMETGMVGLYKAWEDYRQEDIEQQADLGESPVEDEGMTEETREVLSRVLKDGTIELFTTPNVESLRQTPTSVEQVDVSTEDLEHGNPQIEIQPLLTEKFTYTITAEDFPKPGEDGWNVESVTVEDMDTKVAGKSYVDKYGNNVRSFAIIVEGDIVGHQTVIVDSGFAFEGIDTPEGNTDTTFAPVNMDLSDVGLGEIRGAFQQPVIPKVGEAGPFDVFSNDLDEETVNELLGPNEGYLVGGLTGAADLFGQDHGTLRGVHIIDANAMNASFYQPNPEIININDEMLRGEGEESHKDVERVGFHEVMHKYDHEFFQMAENENWQAVFDAMSTDEFKEINEKVFLGGLGGHADENPNEFFASFMSSMTHEDWEYKIQTVSPGLQEKYVSALTVFAEELKDADGIPYDAPVHDLVQERIDFLMSDTLQSFD